MVQCFAEIFYFNRGIFWNETAGSIGLVQFASPPNDITLVALSKDMLVCPPAKVNDDCRAAKSGKLNGVFGLLTYFQLNSKHCSYLNRT